MTNKNQLLATQAAADIAEVTVGTIGKWCRDDGLQHRRPGRSYIIRRGDLEVFLKKPRKRPGQYDRATLKKRGNNCDADPS